MTARIEKIVEIKKVFLAVCNDDEGDALEAMVSAVTDLQALSMDQSAAVHTVAQWGVEGGLFDQAQEPQAEEQAAEIIKERENA